MTHHSREKETQEAAFKRADEMLNSIYTKIPGYDITLCDRAAPDYGLLVNSTFTHAL